MTETSQDNSGPNSDLDNPSDMGAASSVAPSSTVEAGSTVDSAASDAASDRSATAPSSQAKVRRSSLRPAPADYRPSVRDPSTMRPMMVVRAGDAEPIPAHADANEPGQETQQPPEFGTDDDAFARAKEIASGAAAANSPVVIPPAPAVPIDLVPRTTAQARDAHRVSSPGLGGAPHPEQSTHADVMSRPEGKRPSPRPLAIGLVAVTLLTIVLVLKHGANDRQLRATRAPAVAELPRAAAPSAALERPAPTAALEQQRPLTAERSVAKEAAMARAPTSADQMAAVPASAAAVPEAPVASAPAAGTTRVLLEVKPVDAKVYMRGREVPGPPYRFDIGKNQRIAVEVVRFGFVTAKVVLDDKKPVVSYGMLHERWKKTN